MTETTYIVTTPNDIEELMLTLRHEDRVELEIGTGQLAQDVIEQSVWNSGGAGTLRVDRELLAIVGLGSAALFDDVDTGVPWLVGSTAIDRHKLTFMRWTRERVLLFLEQYEYLFNYVYAENHRSVEWLEAIGFDVQPVIEYGPLHAPFRPFSMKRSV